MTVEYYYEKSDYLSKNMENGLTPHLKNIPHQQLKAYKNQISQTKTIYKDNKRCQTNHNNITDYFYYDDNHKTPHQTIDPEELPKHTIKGNPDINTSKHSNNMNNNDNDNKSPHSNSNILNSTKINKERNKERINMTVGGITKTNSTVQKQIKIIDNNKKVGVLATIIKKAKLIQTTTYETILDSKIVVKAYLQATV